MRIRAAVAIVAVLLPTVVSAQRIPRTGTARRGPGRAAPLPPQAAPIAQELAYRRLRLSVESYPMVSRIQSPGFMNDGLITGWTSFGMGTRADYRVSPHLSATLDLTSSLLGGPAVTQTAELGTRLHPERSERRLYPFVDLRAGYVYAYNRYLGSASVLYGDPATQGTTAARYNHGFGGVGGVGTEYALTRSWSLTTAASVIRSRMTARALESGQLSDRHYAMTAYRYTIGVRYNPVRVIRASGTDAR